MSRFSDPKLEAQMPDDVPEGCRSCPKRLQAERVRGLSEDSDAVVDAVHAHMGSRACLGSGIVLVYRHGTPFEKPECRNTGLLDEPSVDFEDLEFVLSTDDTVEQQKPESDFSRILGALGTEVQQIYDQAQIAEQAQAYLRER